MLSIQPLGDPVVFCNDVTLLARRTCASHCLTVTLSPHISFFVIFFTYPFVLPCPFRPYEFPFSFPLRAYLSQLPTTFTLGAFFISVSSLDFIHIPSVFSSYLACFLDTDGFCSKFDITFVPANTVLAATAGTSCSISFIR